MIDTAGCSICEKELHVGTFLDKDEGVCFYLFCPDCDMTPVEDVITPDDDDDES